MMLSPKFFLEIFIINYNKELLFNLQKDIIYTKFIYYNWLLNSYELVTLKKIFYNFIIIIIKI